MKKVLTFLFVVIVLITTLTLSACNVDTPTNSTTTTTTTQTPDEPHVHKYGDWEVVENPTCNSSGLEERACECGQKQNNAIAPIDCVAGEWTVDKEATCAEDGTSSRYCIFCGEQMDTTITFSVGHIINITVVSEMSCTQDGLVRHECTREGCDYSYEIETKAEHNVELEEKVDATCTADGYIKYGCTKCDFEEITVIYGGHNYTSEVTKKSTGDEKGEMTYTCSNCGDSYVEEIPMLKPGLYVLLIEDTTPWRTNTNVEILNSLVDAGYIAYWEKIASSQIGNTDLLKYGMILIANEQSDTTYKNLVNNKEKLHSFANDGGVLIYGACDQGWKGGNIGSAFLGEIKKGNYYSYRNYIVNAEHPIVTGALTDGISLTNELLYHNYTSHSYFMSLPQRANIILQDAKGNPTLVEYELGSGHVIVSGLTWEHNAKYEYNPSGSYANSVYDDLLIYATTLANTCQHEYDDGVKKEATCTESGYTLYTCAVCGFAYKNDIVQPLGHNYVNGYCTMCGKRISIGLEYEFNKDTQSYSVIGIGTCKDTDVIIPDTYKGLPVTSIGTRAFSNYTRLTSIEIPSSVTSISSVAFLGCTSLTSINIDNNNQHYKSIDGNLYSKNGKTLIQYAIGKSDYSFTIPDSVTSVDMYAFYRCTALTSIEIPAGVTSIDKNSFGECISLKSVIFEEGSQLMNISNYAFHNCTSLTSIEIPNSVTSIDSYAFGNCTSLTNIEIPNSITSIGSGAFYYCTSLESVTFEENSQLTSIDSYAFCNCTSIKDVYYTGNVEAWLGISLNGNYSNPMWYGANLYFEGELVTNLVIPDSVKSIGKYAFYGCDSLLNVEISDSVTSIGYSVFETCVSLESVMLGDTSQLASIGSSTFSGCTSLTNIVIPNGVKSIGDSAFYNCTSLTSIEIPDSITSIGSSTFSGCTSLTNMVIPNGVKSIGDSAFYNCTSLTSIEIPDSITSIGSSTFSGCTSLTNIVISNGVKSIGDSAFYNCTSLTSIEIPNSVTNIGSSAFGDCISLISIVIPDSVTSISSSTFSGCTSLINIEIPKGVTSIGEYTFCNCTSLTSIEIPASVMNIGRNVFEKCTSLEIVVFEENIQLISIGYYVFYGCTSLISIDIPESVTNIDSSAFSHCTSLESIEIPESLTSIHSQAFVNCPSLKDVYYAGDVEDWLGINFYDSYSNPMCNGAKLYLKEELITNLVIPDSVTDIGDWAFYNCISLSSIQLSDSVINIGEWAFYNCISLKSIIFGNNSQLTSIGGCAFNTCISLTSIEIPVSVTSIGGSAFYNCTSLTSIEIPYSVTSIAEDAFVLCTSLVSINVDNNNQHYKLIDGNLYSKDGKTLVQYAIGKQDTSFAIPEGVTSIGSCEFSGCTSLISIKIPDSVTSISGFAFEDCILLESVIFGENSQLKSIGNHAFDKCTSLTSIEIPNSVTSILWNAFKDCISLTSINFDGTVEQWNAIDKYVSNWGSWDENTGDYTIYCTDGKISKDGTVTYY